MTQQEEDVGIDVSKSDLDIGYWPEGEKLNFPNDRQGWGEVVKCLGRRKVRSIGLEASGGYERGLLKALLDAGLPARRVNPLRVRQFAKACGIMAKNDRIDAVVIARFVAMVPQRAVERNPAAEAMAELVTARRQICEELTRAQNQAEHACQTIVKRLAKRRIDRLKAEILLLDKALVQAVEADDQLAHKNALLRSVPGVGPVYAHTLLGLMPELGTLTNRQAGSLLGVAPFDCESGAYKGQRRIFGGREAVRDVAYMAALAASKYNPVLKAFQQRLRDAGKRPKVIIVAIMRKLITILNAILRDNQPWAHS